MSLEEFRSNLDDLYTITLASDSHTMTRLTAHIEISEACGVQSTFYRIKGPEANLRTQSIAEATRAYYGLVYDAKEGAKG
jgi:hypothetical protein